MIKRVRCLRGIFLTVTTSSMVPEQKNGPRPSSHCSFICLCANRDKGVCEFLPRHKICETRLVTYYFVSDTMELA